MNYPFWDAGASYGILMALIAIPHVFVSHFAIGGGLYLVLAERAARRQDDRERLAYLERLSRFFVLVSLVFGALTGVGIWFIIGLLNPAGTAVLIHNFVWGWAIEWTFFLVEICAAILYYLGWKRMSVRNHLTVGWIYFVSAWLSLVVINGIVAFMLTPGRWLETGNFWDGFFNPTYWPMLLLRTGVCVMLAGLYSLWVISRYPASSFKTRTVRGNAAWAMTGLVSAALCFLWYRSAIPAEITNRAAEIMTKPGIAQGQMMLYGLGIAFFLVVFCLARPRWWVRLPAGILLLLGLLAFGAFEWYRESIRKPFVIHGYMYANGIDLARADAYRRDGLLAHMTFRTGDDGADLFRRACASCHTMDGYQPLRPALDGTDVEFIAGLIRGAHVMRGNMPPFLGSDEEVEILARAIHRRIDTRPLAEITGLEGVALGRKVWEIRCGVCHQFGGYNDNSDSVIGLEDEDYEDLFEVLGELTEEMPPFTADATEREALITYLKSLDDGGAR